VLRKPRPDFGIFWVAQTLSTAGDSFSYVAIPLLVLHATGSVTQMGLLTGLTGAASILAGILRRRSGRSGGPAAPADRCDVGRAMLYALVPLAWVLGHRLAAVPGHALGGAFACCSRSPTSPSYQSGRAGSDHGGERPALCVVCRGEHRRPDARRGRLGLFGPTTAIAIDAASFAISGLGLFLVRLVL